jgi:OOP family OmpA-OmpF porin
MKLDRISGLLGLMLLAGHANVSLAQQTAVSGWYAGAGGGVAKAKIDRQRITASLAQSGFSSTIEDDNRDGAFKFFGGYRLSPNFALEGGYFDLGKFGYTAATVPAGTLTGQARVRGLNLDLVASLPVTEKLSVFGRAGVTRAQARDTFRGTGLVVVNNPNPRERATNAKFGFGLDYAFTPLLSGRAEIERYRIDDAVGNRGDIDTATVGLVYRF